MKNLFFLIFLITTSTLGKRVSFQLTKKVKPPNDISSELPLSSLSLDQGKRLTVDLTNVQNIQYYGTLKIGSSQIEMKFTFDTGSNELWFPTTSCTSCQAGTVRYDTSSSSYYQQTSTTLETITYGRGQVSGFPSYDQVWFSNSQKVNQMPCLAVTEQKDLNGIVAQGILGLAPLKDSPFLLDIMKDNGIIDRRTLSFAFHGTAEQTTLTFGEPDMSLAPSNTLNGTFPIARSNYLYFTNIYSSKINETTLGTSSNTLALIDTGTSLLAIPSTQYNNLLNFYQQNGANLLICGGLVCTSCNYLLNVNLTVQLGAHQFTVPHQSLWVTTSGLCQLQAQQISGNQWILGDVFIRNYFVVMDYDRSQITLYGQSVSNASIPSDSKSYTGWIVAGVIVGVILIAIIIVCLRKKCKCKKKQTQGQYAAQGIRVGGSPRQQSLLRYNAPQSPPNTEY